MYTLARVEPLDIIYLRNPYALMQDIYDRIKHRQSLPYIYNM